MPNPSAKKMIQDIDGGIAKQLYGENSYIGMST